MKGSDAHRKALFDNEKRTLLLLNSRKHPNITPFYGAYKHGRELCFLFPVLDMDLECFFKRDRYYADFKWDSTFAAALHGLSSALRCLHDVCLRRETEGVDFTGLGYHHDFRPSNILVTRETFVLADFGLGRLKPHGEDSQTPWKFGVGDYLAPECMDKNLEKQDVGRAIDVWALGCLAAEVLTFMHKGPEGLNDFCTARLSPGYFVNQTTSYYFDTAGNMKGVVGDWLDALLTENSLLSHTLLRDLIPHTLIPSSRRPTISKVSSSLHLLSAVAYYEDVLECFDKIVEDGGPGLETPGISMKLWFERERLKAFGKVLYLDGFEGNSPPQISESFRGNEYSAIMKRLLRVLDQFNHAQPTPMEKEVSNVENHPTITSIPLLEKDQPIHTDTLNFHANELQESIQQLWELLPSAKMKKAESFWVSAMLKVEEPDQLSDLQQTLRSQEPTMYQEVAALAMMKQIRLELSAHRNSLSGPMRAAIEEPLSQDDVTELDIISGHQTGLFKTMPVIIEWMFYDKSWEKIPVAERILCMQLKAKGFDVVPKPASLRTLRCLGFYELTERPYGYGFVYEVPRVSPVLDPPRVQMVTLNSLLRRSMGRKEDPYLSQPLLEHKYQLASILADFIEEFHTIGWLHENLHSNNIIFVDGVLHGRCISPPTSRMITEPHILGLHKCRPGGDEWHTQGPTTAAEFPDYTHPCYEATRHYRHSYDYYTVGLVLLEIGLWTPLEAWRKKNKDLKPDEFRAMLVEKYIPRLGPRMGSVYKDIVQKCLTDGLDSISRQREPDAANEYIVCNRFIEEVSEPLSMLAKFLTSSGL